MQLNKIGFFAAKMQAHQVAQRRGMAKAVEYRTNKTNNSEKTDEKDGTGSTSSSNSKQAKAFEILEQAAAKVQEYASKLKELSAKKSEEIDEKKLKEDAYSYVDKLVEAYNELYKKMQDMGDETNKLHCEQMSRIYDDHVDKLSVFGITKKEDGTLAIDKEKLSVEGLQATTTYLSEISDKCAGIEAGAAASIKLWNSLYGTLLYDDGAKGSGYYGENGGLYSALG